MKRLERLVRTIHGHQVVSQLTCDPDPAPTHEYERSGFSGSGNCICGVAQVHRRHPHPFTPTASDPSSCCCALPESARCHTAKEASE